MHVKILLYELCVSLIVCRHYPPLSSDVAVGTDDQRYLVINLCGGRLGNRLFVLASIIGAAKTLNRTAFVNNYTSIDQCQTLLKFIRLLQVGRIFNDNLTLKKLGDKYQ